MISKWYGRLAFLMLLLPASAMSQDMVIDDWFTTTQYLNVTIANDTGSAAFKAGTRVYVLKKDGIYAWNATIQFTAGSIITFRAEYGGTGHYDPVIYFFPTTAGTGAPPGRFCQLSGNSTIHMTHIMMSGYEETVDTLLQFSNTQMIQTLSTGTNNRIIIDSCVMKTIAGQIIRTEGPAQIIKITNSIFADMGHPTSNFGAGKFIDARNVRIDTLIVQNCTLINLYDRVIRHYQASAANAIMNFVFDHNTVINDMAYHGFLSLGRVDSTGTGTLQITNNLLIDHFALGMDTAAVRQGEFTDPGEIDPVNNQPRMAWVLTNKNDAANWNIQKNYYASSDSGKAMLALGPPNDTIYAGPYYHRQGPPYLTLNMNKVLASHGKDTLNTFIPVDIIRVNKAPRLMTELIRWILNKNLDKKNKPTLNVSPIWNWTYDFDRHKLEYYYDTLNCSYTASVNLSAAGTDGKIVGDTRWTFNGVVPPVKPVMTIAAARADGNSDLVPDNLGDSVQVFGVVTTPNLSGTTTSYFIQDGTAGIDVFYDGTLDRTFKVGDSVAVVGRIDQYRGLTEIIPLQPDSAYFGYLKHNAAIPAAQKITLHQFVQNPEAYEARLVEIDTLYKVSGTWGSAGEVTVTNKAQTDTALIYINAGTNVAAFHEPQYPINVTAVVNQHSSSASVVTGGYELIPVDSARIVVVSVQNRDSGIPHEFYMSPNYPNPFNPSTTVEFGLPRETHVQIVVYNVLGQRVALLVDRSMKAGNYKMVFDASRLASGVYFYVMNTGEKVFKQKMLLLK